MDELEISGQRYISAKRAGKEHKYHPDYIGQLIRGGKVEGQKVGRAWYVHAKSLSTYLNKEAPVEKVHMPERVPEVFKDPEVIKEVVEENKPVPIAVPIQVQPIIKHEFKSDVPHIAKIDLQVEEPATFETNEHAIPIHKNYPPQVAAVFPVRKVSSLTYIADDEPLLPQTRRVSFAQNRPIQLQPEHQDGAVEIIERPVFKSSTNRAIRKIASLAFIAAATLSITLSAAYLINSQSTIAGGKSTASIFISKF